MKGDKLIMTLKNFLVKVPVGSGAIAIVTNTDDNNGRDNYTNGKYFTLEQNWNWGECEEEEIFEQLKFEGNEDLIALMNREVLEISSLINYDVMAPAMTTGRTPENNSVVILIVVEGKKTDEKIWKEGTNCKRLIDCVFPYVAGEVSKNWPYQAVSYEAYKKLVEIKRGKTEAGDRRYSNYVILSNAIATIMGNGFNHMKETITEEFLQEVHEEEEKKGQFVVEGDKTYLRTNRFMDEAIFRLVRELIDTLGNLTAFYWFVQNWELM